MYDVLMEERDPVRDFPGERDFMGDGDHRHALPGQHSQCVENLAV